MYMTWLQDQIFQFHFTEENIYICMYTKQQWPVLFMNAAFFKNPDSDDNKTHFTSIFTKNSFATF